MKFPKAIRPDTVLAERVTAARFMQAFIDVLRESPLEAPSMKRITRRLGLPESLFGSDARRFRVALLKQRGFVKDEATGEYKRVNAGPLDLS